MDGSRSGNFTQVSIPDGYDRFMLGQLFEPWAADLVSRANLKPGFCVLDVASGLGPMARLAAEAAGPGGRVVASDISAAMLAAASARPEGPGWATIEYLQCPASAIAAEDDRFDVVLCRAWPSRSRGHSIAVVTVSALRRWLTCCRPPAFVTFPLRPWN